MEKKGFTLIELLGVIVVLSIIGLITVPIITSVVNDSKDKALAAQQDAVKRAAKHYVDANIYGMPTCTAAAGSTCLAKQITIGELKNAGFLEASDIENPKTNTKYSDSDKVNIKMKNGNYIYEFPVS